MKVEERLESVAVGGDILHGWYVSILKEMDNSGQLCAAHGPARFLPP
jgi:hypothetical protein